MQTKLGKAAAAACGLALLLSLGACGRGSEGGADRAVRNSTATEQGGSAGSNNDAAVRAAVQRSAANNTAAPQR